MSQENPISKQPLIRHVNRQQMSWRAVDVEHLISEDHPARAIWALVGRLNLSTFYQAIESSTEEGGRPAFDPQLLISLWIYAYSQGIGSAREVARHCEYCSRGAGGAEPGRADHPGASDARMARRSGRRRAPGVIAGRKRFANIWSRRDDGWWRWVIPGTRTALLVRGAG